MKTEKHTISALYHFADFTDYKEWQEPLKMLCAEQEIFGTLLLAAEGINGTIAGPNAGVKKLLDYIRADKRFENLVSKESYADKKPFYRAKIKLKKEIVTLGIPGTDPNKTVGTYVKPKDWNKIINDPDIPVLDTRNDYEFQIGSFKNAVDPKTKSFTEFPGFVKANYTPEKHKKIAMFCTGGIRCEKASSYMLEQGFEEVYHLEGGILKYLEEVPESESTWEGECFVFDRRVGVKHGLEAGNYDSCYGCRRPISESDKLKSDYIQGVQCHQCKDEHSDSDKQRFAMRQRQIKLARQNNQEHIGA